jgi:hypothetical protein
MKLLLPHVSLSLQNPERKVILFGEATDSLRKKTAKCLAPFFLSSSHAIFDTGLMKKN